MQLLRTAATHWPVLFSWGQLATLNGRKARGGHFNASRKELIVNELVIERDGKIEPTDAGFAAAGVVRKHLPVTPNELLAVWIRALPSPARDILKIVAEKDGPVAVQAVAARLRLAPRGGHWNGGVSLLRTNGLIRVSPRGIELGEGLSI
jgi:hypothetical protein